MVVLDKRFSNRWQGRVSYVLSKAEGYFSNWDWPPDTFGQSTLFETPTRALVNSFGQPETDRTHELKVFATYKIPKIDVGLNAYYRFLTGWTYTPYQRYRSRDIDYPLSSGRSPLLEPRGDRRMDNESYLDLRIEKSFNLGGTNRLAVYADIQNLFNAGTVIYVQDRYPLLSISGEGTSVDVPFEAPSQIYDPRRLILGARWSF